MKVVDLNDILYGTECPMILCQYVEILFLKPFPGRNVTRFSAVTEIWVFGT
jgi:hypothetical protein